MIDLDYHKWLTRINRTADSAVITHASVGILESAIADLYDDLMTFVLENDGTTPEVMLLGVGLPSGKSELFKWYSRLGDEDKGRE